MPNELIPSGNYDVRPSVLDQAAAGAKRQLEYLRGHEADVGRFFKALFLIVGSLFLVIYRKEVLDTVTDIVEIQTKVIYGSVLAVMIWLIWLVLSSQKFQHTVTMLADTLVEKLHRAAVARDPEGAARFSINKLYRKIKWGEEGKSKVGSALEMVTNAVEDARAAITHALNEARGLTQEKANRAAGKPNPAIDLTNQELDHAIVLAKGELRRQYELFQEQGKNAQELERRYQVIRDVLDSSKVELTNMERDLEAAKRRYALNFAQMEAMEASDAVVESQERRTFKQAMGLIADRADLMAGRTRMILDRLDGNVKAYKAGKAADVIADEAFFQAIANDSELNIIKDETKEKLLSAPERPVIADLEKFLSGKTPSPEKVRRSEPKSAGGVKRRNSGGFDDLLGDGR